MNTVVKRLVNECLDKMKPGMQFQSNYIISYVRGSMIRNMEYPKRPHDSTVLRYVRERRAKRHDVRLVDKPKSIYEKIMP